MILLKICNITTNYTAFKLICLAGLAGSGKSTASDIFVKSGFSYLRFGQIVIDEVVKRKLEINEKNERAVREELRSKHGMAVMAKLNIPKIKKLLKEGPVVVDGLYSFAEYKILKKEFKDKMVVLAIYAPPALRYNRIKVRVTGRRLTKAEAVSRDYAEIEKLDKGGPIAMADYTLVNTGTKKKLKKQVDIFLRSKEVIKNKQT